MLKKVSSFYVRRICLRKLLFQLYKEMKKKVKQKAVKRQGAVGKKTMNSRLSLSKYQFTRRNMRESTSLGRSFFLFLSNTNS